MSGTAMKSIHESPIFVIQQTLHGYSDGHRLLASSCKLPRDAESLMLILSDLSGPGGGDQFDPYLTGYPLESAGRYALACTWPAPEMGRPGCVWTHTLLLGEELLAETNNPEEFVKLFRRPATTSGFGEFLGGMRVPELCGARSERTRPMDDWTAWLGPRLLQALYGSSAPFTALAVPRYAAAEMPLLSIWRLQWPKLRRHFTFCGGARAVRTVEGRPMDLQAAVERDIRRLDRGTQPPAIVPGDPPLEPAASEWIDAASAAYQSPDAHNLVGFFNRIGDALPADPALFRPAVTAHAILGRSSAADAAAQELVSYAATEFPDVAGGEFKCAFLGASSVTGLPDLAVLRALADTEYHGAFDASALQVRPRSAALWTVGHDAWGLMSRLLSRPGTPLSEAVLGGLIDAMPAEALLSALDAGGDVLEGFVRRSPQIAASPQYWSPPAERQSRAVRALPSGGDRARGLMGEIIRVAIETGADPVGPDLIDVFGDGAVPVVLDWLDSTLDRRLPPNWREAIRRRPHHLLAWLVGGETATEETAQFILSAIDIAALFPNRELVAALDRFLPLIEAVGVENAAAIACSAFRVALNASSSEGAALASASLDTVYHAAMHSRLPDDAWWSIANDLPEGYWWQSWDRCERLRRAVVERFRSKQWPASGLVGITRDDGLFGALVAELRDSRSGRRVLSDAIDSGASDGRREVLMNE